MCSKFILIFFKGVVLLFSWECDRHARYSPQHGALCHWSQSVVSMLWMSWQSHCVWPCLLPVCTWKGTSSRLVKTFQHPSATFMVKMGKRKGRSQGRVKHHTGQTECAQYHYANVQRSVEPDWKQHQYTVDNQWLVAHVLVTRLPPLNSCLLLNVFKRRYSPLSSRLTALACDSTRVTSFFIACFWISTAVVYLTVLTWLVPHETAGVCRVLFTPYTMSLHAKPHI